MTGEKLITWNTRRNLKAFKSEHNQKQASEATTIHFGGEMKFRIRVTAL